MKDQLEQANDALINMATTSAEYNDFIKTQLHNIKNKVIPITDLVVQLKARDEDINNLEEGVG